MSLIQSFSNYTGVIDAEKWHTIITTYRKYKWLIAKHAGISASYLMRDFDPDDPQDGNDGSVMKDPYEIKLMNDMVIYCATHPYKYLASFMCTNAEYYDVRGRHRREIPTDFLGDVVTDEKDSETGSSQEVKLDTEEAACAFVESLLDEIAAQSEECPELVTLLFDYPEEFDRIVFGVSIRNEKLPKKLDLNDDFKMRMTEISEFYPNFHRYVAAMYKTLQYSLPLFLNSSVPGWQIYNEAFVKEQYLVHGNLVSVEDETTPVEDADLTEYYIRGVKETSGVYMIRYSDLFDYICNLYSSETSNVAFFTYQDMCMYKLPSGYISVPEKIHNSRDMFWLMLEKLRMEIVTNILKHYKGRLIHVGSYNIYIVTPKRESLLDWDINIFGFDYSFNPIDITSELDRVTD